MPASKANFAIRVSAATRVVWTATETMTNIACDVVLAPATVIEKPTTVGIISTAAATTKFVYGHVFFTNDGRVAQTIGDSRERVTTFTSTPASVTRQAQVRLGHNQSTF
mmetsp:Transcript_15839/g.36336  ORF Transcript_15839/g.36336 Transcript_15839/m.36336 type:complete len:109 (-) Transcript_15839:361-687(-)